MPHFRDRINDAAKAFGGFSRSGTCPQVTMNKAKIHLRNGNAACRTDPGDKILGLPADRIAFGNGCKDWGKHSQIRCRRGDGYGPITSIRRSHMRFVGQGFFCRQRAHLTVGEVAELDRSEARAPELLHLVADLREHAPDLPIASLAEHDPEPGRALVLLHHVDALGAADVAPPEVVVERDAVQQPLEGVPGRPLWQWFAVLALLLFTADWIIWARRT